MNLEPQPWHEGHHGDRWMDDDYIAKFLELHWGWLPDAVLGNPPKLPLTHGQITYQPGYFEKLPGRKMALAEARSSVRRAEARKLAYELWFWRQWWLKQKLSQT